VVHRLAAVCLLIGRSTYMKSHWILGAAITAALALGLISCGGGDGGPAGPTTTPAADGTVLTIVSGETDSPVSGARVTVDGGTFTTNSAGQVTLPQRPANMAPIDILAAGYLDRLTVFRGQETRLSLWPRRSPTGLLESDTVYLVYTHVNWRDGVPPLLQVGAAGGDSLRQRYSRAPVQVFYSDGFEGADSWAIDNQAAAVAELNDAIGGGLTYVPPRFAEIPAANMGELHVALTIDPTHASCASGFVATGEPPPAGLAGGTLRVNYCSVRYAGILHVAMHELGHTFGLRHTADSNDVMSPGSESQAFTPKERLVMRLMLQRRPGNTFPDTDVCRWRPSWCLD